MSLENQIEGLTEVLKFVGNALKENTATVQAMAMSQGATTFAPQPMQTLTTDVIITDQTAATGTVAADAPKKRGPKPKADAAANIVAAALSTPPADAPMTIEQKLADPAFRQLVELVNEMLDGGAGEADVKSVLQSLGVARASELPPERWAGATHAFSTALQNRANNTTPAAAASFV